ncbi:MAG: BamA/TamA family outer membrane protein, partial [Bacteroidetes bacterium]|nr:BamA/TamA family outer membrane protein [Bacteroidota bacterium]
SNHGFRKAPYKSSHFLLASVALATGSYEFNYKVEFIESIGKLDLLFDGVALAPTFISNFFGFGNESTFDENIDDDPTINVDKAIDYYRTSFKQFGIETLLRKRVGENFSISFGHHFQAFEAEDDYDGESRFILDSPDTIDIFKWRSYNGGVLKLNYDSRDKKGFPSRGFHLNMEARAYAPLNSISDEFGILKGEASLYIPLLPEKVIFATRIGAGHSFGNFEFYQAQILDGLNELRGYRKTRFFGDTKAYYNSELRFRLLSFKNPVAPATVGITLFNDVGRVWYGPESSDKWHYGFGGGIWIAPLNAVVIGVDVGLGEEETLAYFRLGFMF